MNMKRHRRSFLAGLAALPAALMTSRTEAGTQAAELFGEPDHKLVYQYNKADPEYADAVMFSLGVMLRQHTDNIHLVVSAFGPGIHILAKKPQRPVSEEIRRKVSSLAAYGVSFHACRKTLEGLNWTAEDLFDFVEIVDSGADDLMLLQEEGYSYISW